jgi:hypothetical protein
LPPECRCFGERKALMPIDPQSDGSWIAVNDAGLVMALLNRTPDGAVAKSAPLSRGAILPLLLHCDDLGSAEWLALDLNGDGFAPFRLIVANRDEFTVIDGGGDKLRAKFRGVLIQSLMFTSSGLGDSLVDEPRRRLFGDLFATPTRPHLQQDLFHRHSWPGAEPISVCMRRPDARTVSHTLVELTCEEAVMTYFPQAPDEKGPAIAECLQLESKISHELNQPCYQSI